MSFDVAPVVKLNLRHVDRALQAFCDTPSRTSSEASAPFHRSINTFLYLVEESGAIYDSVRQLIDDRDYWEIEDRHFYKINALISSWNAREGRHTSLEHAEVPPVQVIKQLYRETHQKHDRRKCTHLPLSLHYCIENHCRITL